MFNRNGWGRSIFKYHSISKHLSASLFVFAVFGRFLGGNHDNSQPAEAWHRLNYPAYNWVIWSRRNMTWQVEDFPWFSYMIIMAGTNLVRTATVCIVSCGFCRSPSWSSQTGSWGPWGPWGPAGGSSKLVAKGALGMGPLGPAAAMMLRIWITFLEWECVVSIHLAGNTMWIWTS
jgi:hypothetical protein